MITDTNAPTTSLSVSQSGAKVASGIATMTIVGSVGGTGPPLSGGRLVKSRWAELSKQQLQ